MQTFGRIGRPASFICVSLALLVTAGMSLRFLPDVRGDGLANPDSYMRLVRLRDMLTSGHVVYAVARDGSGHGTLLHWSHLIDGLLCVLALPFGLFMDQESALHAAAVLWGPLNIAALAFAVIWAGAPFAERKWLFLGAILPPLSPAIISYGMAGVVHHHVGIAIAAVACWGWAARVIKGIARAEAGIALGAWIGAGVWLSPESTPLTMMAFGALWLGWIAYPERADIARAIGQSGISFAVVTLLALLADPPAAGIGAIEIDRLSLLFGGLSLAVAATGGALWALHGKVRDRGSRIAAGCAVAVDFAAVWGMAFRHSMLNGNMLLDAAQRDAMFAHVNEMLPVIGVLPVLHFLLTGICAALLAAALAVRGRSLLLTYTTLCLTFLLWLGSTHVRFAAYPEAAGAIALPIAVTFLGQMTARRHQVVQSFVRLAAILLFIQVPYVGMLPNLTGSAQAAAAVALPACKPSDAIGLLAAHAGAVVLADVNDTPELLWKTGIRTVGSLYHRDMDGFMRLRAAWRVPPSATVPREIDDAEVSLVLSCLTPARWSMMDDIPGATLHDQLRTGHPPPWLRQIGENPVSGHVLYEVVR